MKSSHLANFFFLHTFALSIHQVDLNTADTHTHTHTTPGRSKTGFHITIKLMLAEPALQFKVQKYAT